MKRNFWLITAFALITSPFCFSLEFPVSNAVFHQKCKFTDGVTNRLETFLMSSPFVGSISSISSGGRANCSKKSAHAYQESHSYHIIALPASASYLSDNSWLLLIPLFLRWSHRCFPLNLNFEAVRCELLVRRLRIIATEQTMRKPVHFCKSKKPLSDDFFSRIAFSNVAGEFIVFPGYKVSSLALQCQYRHGYVSLCSL